MSLYNLLHGVNPLSPLFLAMLGLEVDQVPRFRDIYLMEAGGELLIAVYTRMGGGNRGHWFYSSDEEEGPECSCPGCTAKRVLEGHPLHAYNQDDDFDCTYATYFFKVPECFQEPVRELSELSDQKSTPAESWERCFKKLGELKPGEEGDEETRQWLEVGKEAIQHIMDAMGVTPQEEEDGPTEEEAG